MEYLSNEKLVEVYTKAIILDVDKDFIALLEKEIKRRGLRLEDYLNNNDEKSE